MANVLFLAHRIPYPPNKGDKIRSYHLLRHLARKHRVFLGAFIDDPHDARYADAVAAMCAGQFLPRLRPLWRRLASASALLAAQPLSLPYYRDAALQRWVDETIASERIDAVVTFSSTMAQYVAGPRYEGLTRIADFVDVDSDKWLQYANRSRGPKSLLYAREARQLLDYERRIAAQFDATLFVADAEAGLFRELAPETSARVSHYENGVDTEYFDPSIVDQDPYPEGGPVLVFTGAMDYWPNVEAVTWFADEVLPLVRRSSPGTRFAIVGSNPTERVGALARREGVMVTGRVADVRPYLHHAAVAVAPLRIARGVQNKVLEALAMARPMVCTREAAQSLRPASVVDSATACSTQEFADKVLANAARGELAAHRDYVIANYSWEANLAAFDRMLEKSGRRTHLPELVAMDAA